MNYPAAEMREIENKEQFQQCHSGLSRIFLQKDSRQAGVTDKRQKDYIIAEHRGFLFKINEARTAEAVKVRIYLPEN